MSRKPRSKQRAAYEKRNETHVFRPLIWPMRLITRMMQVMSIVLGVAIGASAYADTGATGPEPASISINDFTRDKALFDSGAALGQNSATIDIAGTATIGRDVQLRARSVEDGGVTSTSWIDVGTADAGGNWSGSVTVSRNVSWYQMEARVKDNIAVTARTVNRFGVGHVIAIWGQSEVARIVDSFGDSGGLTAPTLITEDAVQVIRPTFNISDPVIHEHLTNTNYGTVSLAYMANTLLAERPNDKFALIFQVDSGTSFQQLMDDGMVGRDWALDKALHDFATADGQVVGIAAASWFAAPRNAGTGYEEAHFPMFFGINSDGSSVTIPGDYTWATGQTWHLDHSFAEIYDYSQTRWVAYGPHRFEVGNESSIETVRGEWRTMAANPNAGGAFLPYGLEPLSYVSGYDNGDGTWTDISHPSPYTVDGGPRLAQQTAQAILEAADLVSWGVPEFDNCEWQLDGTYVEVWSSAGPITTTRLSRGEPALDTSHPHWTDVFGFTMNGTAVERAEIVSGRVRIYPASGVFTNTDVLRFGKGGATGAVLDPEDFFAETWMNYPLVDMGQASLEGIPVRALPDPSLFENTVAGTSTFNVTSSGPKFDQSIVSPNIGSGHSALTFEARVRGVSSTSFDLLGALTGSRFGVEVGPAGARGYLRDSGNNVLASPGDFEGDMIFDQWNTIRVAADLPGGWMRMFVNDVEAASVTFSSPTNQFYASSRWLAFWTDWSGEVEYVKIWMEATPDGSTPASVPYEQITGPAAAANAHPWKTSGSAGAS